MIALVVADVSPAQERPGETLAALVLEAEARLAHGDAISAIDSFERVTRMGHDPSAEMGLVRAYMQDGQYRRALAFCAHVAAEHLDVPGAAILYAELLRAGGQEAVAKTVIAAAIANALSDELVLEAAQAFDSSAPLAEGVLLRTPHRIAPVELSMPGQSSVPRGARVVSSGVLMGDGRHALVPAAATIDDGRRVARLWVRDGFGRTREAAIDSPALVPTPGGAVVLRLLGQLATAGVETAVTNPPFSGSPGYVLEYAQGRSAAPAWPRLRMGFLGATSGTAGLRSLGIDVGDSRQGGPVLDASGRVVGIVLRDAANQATLLPVSSWPADASGYRAATKRDRPALAAVASPRRIVPIDEVYERALHLALQVIVAP